MATWKKYNAIVSESPVYKTINASWIFNGINPFYRKMTNNASNKNFTLTDKDNIWSMEETRGTTLYSNSYPPANTLPTSYTNDVIYSYTVKAIHQEGDTHEVKEISYTKEKGSFIDTVQASDGTYPSDGLHSDGFWYVFVPNQIPTISGTDQDLGGKASPFNFPYTVDDKDTTQELTITEKLNGTTLRTISNALRNTEYQVEITEDRFSQLTLNAENTIEISVSDGQGATAYRRLKFRRTNSPPTISITNRELGEQNEPFSFTFTVNDLENDAVRLEFINGGKIIDTMEDITLGEEITYTFDKVTFAQLFNGSQEIVIRAIDINNAASADRVYFNKAVAGAGYIHKYQSDVLCDYVIVWDEIDLADGEVKKLQVCNNFNDENPVWEDAPFNDVHRFNNTTVVNAPDVGVRIEVLDNPNTGNSYINSFMVKAGVISGS